MEEAKQALQLRSEPPMSAPPMDVAGEGLLEAPQLDISESAESTPDGTTEFFGAGWPSRGRLKRVLNKAHLHLGDLLPDPLRVAHLRRGCELLRMVYEERLGARARPSVDGAVAPLSPVARGAG